ncbi:hypothetical protein UNDYM_3369 [Undibacterium sp. YM2]|uniref:DUF262 domain-containing protein n=1 Tax=Undibacterium sp. YM2 TaxID=2058625 RepID=UPI001331CB35|nr:DUF262 domain-containing protein [Undibacterium sp. YM2]BBB67622.1 hypothetical protein UNDYM_3369 [Undibacterium sp. YM2]
MPFFSESELSMWDKSPSETPQAQLTDEQINSKYDKKAERIVTETNREKLQNFYEALKRPGYMDPRPFYQRRNRWDNERQSKLIESFLINIPIPPLFVYEISPNSYEVMDGQQRISAIKAFYSNELVLKGLDRWPELNGRTYSKLPEKIKAGIDRRSVSWITVLHESTEGSEDALILKQLVFERLNTGGVKLSAQEIRNALYAGPFNDALIDLAKNKMHRSAWKLPDYSDVEEKSTPDYLLDDPFYKQMEDIEVILRFFALRHANSYRKGMSGFLDLYILKSRSFKTQEIEQLKALYLDTLELAHRIYKDLIFTPFHARDGKWGSRPQKAFADAVLVALSHHLDKSSKLIENRDSILAQTRNAFTEDTKGILTGRGNTKQDVKDRIALMNRIYDVNSK